MYRIFTRLLLDLSVLPGVATVIFFIFNILPGDPVSLTVGQRADVATKEAVAADLGLDLPMGVRFLHYLNDLSPLSVHRHSAQNELKYEYTKLFNISESAVVLKTPYLRRSFQTGKKVSAILAEHIPGTLWLAGLSICIATIAGILLGVVAALRPHSWLDHSLIAASVAGISAPSFVVAVGMALLFGFVLADYTGLELGGFVWTYHPIHGNVFTPQYLILPVITLSVRPLSVIMQLTRSAMLDVLSQDYIRTAKAKGLSNNTIVWKHALKNALNPVLTAASGWLASLMAGTFFVEYVFNWKGIGYVTVRAIELMDLPVVTGAVLFVACIFVVINRLTDLSYRLLDPTVKE